jgi:hypothetical protein
VRLRSAAQRARQRDAPRLAARLACSAFASMARHNSIAIHAAAHLGKKQGAANSQAAGKAREHAPRSCGASALACEATARYRARCEKLAGARTR